jgi:hypothetical protein
VQCAPGGRTLRAAFDALFTAVAQAMASTGWSDAGTRLPGWLVEAGFASVDPGAGRLECSGGELTRQVRYVADVAESTLPALAQRPGRSAAELEAGVERLRPPEAPGAALGWTVHKASALR